MLRFAAPAELCSAWTDECVRPYAIKDKIGWDGPEARHHTGVCVYSAFVDWKLVRSARR